MLNFQSTPEIDYNFLIWQLRRYKHPRDQITKLIQKGELIRVKKGLYVRRDLMSGPYSKLLLANLVYGPSYVSGHTALSYWGAIPERVEIFESTTWHRRREFKTPVGTFFYRKVPLDSYPQSVQRVQLDDKRSFLIATLEKAVLELFDSHCHQQRRNPPALLEWLQSMRIESDSLAQMNLTTLRSLRSVYTRSVVDGLISEVRKAKAT